MRREFLDDVPFWNARDLERKLAEFKAYYNRARSHASLRGRDAAHLRRGTPNDAGRSEPRAMGLSLPGPRPAPRGCLIRNSRPTGRGVRSTPCRFSESLEFLDQS